jgi:hypothetical protein
MKKEIAPIKREHLCSETARRIYDAMLGGRRKYEKQPKQAGQPASDKHEPLVNLENLIAGSKGGNGAGQPDNPVKAEEPKPAPEEKPDELPDMLRDIVNEAAGKIKYNEPVSRPERGAPSLIDFDMHYFENFFGLIGDQQAKYRTILNMINNTSLLYLGPSSGGKSAIQDASKELLPKGMAVTLNDPSDVDDNLNPEGTIGKAWFCPELQILLRGSKNQKDVVKLLSNHEAYKGMKIEFFATAAAYENDYFQRFIVPNKELMRRLDIVDVEASFGKVKNIRHSMARKRMEGALDDNNNGYTKEYFRDWMTYWRNLKLNAVVDPFCAFHDKYFVMSFKSFDPIKRYHKLEDAMLKMKLDESTYQAEDRQIHILSIREKYRADCFRKNINRSLERLDDIETIRKYLRWTDDEMDAYYESVKKSREDVDWQACWESGIESLWQAQQKGLIPASVISEYINRHVANGKVTVADDYTGEEVVLAEHPPRREVRKDVIVITDLERVFEPEYSHRDPLAVEASQCNPRAIQGQANYAKPVEEPKKLLCLPPGKGDE